MSGAAGKERPILFSAPMVRALLEGRKTQTRRLYKPLYPAPYEFIEDGKVFQADEYGDHHERSVYGVPGDRMWVRETWQTSGNHESALAATGRDTHVGPCFIYAADRGDPGKGWRPSIFMPRGASRIMLEIIEVRVQRLQSISENDARAEGIQELNGRFTFNGGLHESRTARDSFEALWDTINGARASWSSNPWVWAVSFKRVTP